MHDWQDLVAEGRRLVKMEGEVYWRLGDLALVVEPMGQHGGSGSHGRLTKYAEEIGIAGTTLLGYRQTASSWPPEKRRDDVSWTVHRVMRGREDRFDLIRSRPSWTKRDAQEVVGVKTDHESYMSRVTPAMIVEAVRENPDIARALARHEDTRETIEEYGIEARAEKGLAIEAEHDRRRKGIRDAAARHALAWQDDLALGELRQAVDALGAAIMLKEEYGVSHAEKEQELVAQVRRLISAYESGSLSQADQAWLDSLGVAS